MWLICGDLHLTDRTQDQYRFGIFDWIRQQQREKTVAAVLLAGDITDSKDRHSATLVNKIVAGLMKIKPPVYICMGNHDYRDKKTPFFKFLNNIEGLNFVTVPSVGLATKKIAIIPHYRTQDEFDAAVKSVTEHRPDAFLVHQTFDGAIAESGVRLTGLSASLIESINPPLGVYAGDVHRPQTSGQVTYVGCPYQVRFGDDFDPRCIYVADTGIEAYPWFEAPRKWALTVRDADNIFANKSLVSGDQVKLTIEVAREEAIEWKAIRQRVLDACKELDLDVYGVKLDVRSSSKRSERSSSFNSANPLNTLANYCTSEGIAGSIRKIGKEIINGD